MSDVSVFSMKSKNVEKKVDKKTKIVIVIFSILCTILLLEIIAYKVVLPSIGTPKIVISGTQNISNDEIAELLKPMVNTNWFSFNAEQAVSIISSLPAVDSVIVSKRLPDKVFISIKERESVAMTFVLYNGRSYPVYVDKNGVLFNDVNSLQDRSIPIISGMPIEHLSEGMRIPAKYRSLINQVSEIQSRDKRYFAAIAEICVVPKEYGNYELMIIPTRSRTKVLTDRALNEDALQYMMVVLDVVNSLGPNVSEIDLRYGSVSYRTR